MPFMEWTTEHYEFKNIKKIGFADPLLSWLDLLLIQKLSLLYI